MSDPGHPLALLAPMTLLYLLAEFAQALRKTTNQNQMSSQLSVQLTEPVHWWAMLLL